MGLDILWLHCACAALMRVLQVAMSPHLQLHLLAPQQLPLQTLLHPQQPRGNSGHHQRMVSDDGRRG